MFGADEIGIEQFGYSYTGSIPPSALAPIPGFLGLTLFGQPLWLIDYVPIAGHNSTVIDGSAMIVDKKALPYKHTVMITGNAVIQRRNTYLT